VGAVHRAGIHAVALVPMQGSAIRYAIFPSLILRSCHRRANYLLGQAAHLACQVSSLGKWESQNAALRPFGSIGSAPVQFDEREERGSPGFGLRVIQAVQNVAEVQGTSRLDGCARHSRRIRIRVSWSKASLRLVSYSETTICCLATGARRSSSRLLLIRLPQLNATDRSWRDA
jgi:hypothetical protein